MGALADAGLTPQCSKVLLFYIFRVSFKCKLYDGVRTLSSVCALRILSIISRSIDWTPQNILGQPHKMECCCQVARELKAITYKIRKSYPQEWVCCLCKKKRSADLFLSCVLDRNPLWIHSAVTSKHCYSQNYKLVMFSVPCCCLHPFQVSVCCLC